MVKLVIHVCQSRNLERQPRHDTPANSPIDVGCTLGLELETEILSLRATLGEQTTIGMKTNLVGDGQVRRGLDPIEAQAVILNARPYITDLAMRRAIVILPCSYSTPE